MGQYVRFLGFTCLFICFGLCAFARCSYGGPLRHHKKTRNILWVTPSATDHINGLALGIVATKWHGLQTINGANTEFTIICPFLVIPEFVLTVALPVQQHYDHNDKDFTGRFFEWKDSVHECINGLNLSMGTLFSKRQVNGVSLSMASNSYTVHRGLSISLYANWIEDYKGVLIAPFGNLSKKGSGVQIGLVNSCLNCSGLQLGLLNQNGRKITPFLGFRSRRRAVMVAKKGLIGRELMKTYQWLFVL